MPDHGCDTVAPLLPELALGTLDGRDRADALAHLASCPSCRAELRGYLEVADGLLDLVPGAEPPAGFESRVLATVRAGQGGAGSRRPPGDQPRRRRLALAGAAAALVVVAAGITGYGLGHRPGRASPLREATLTADGHPVGAAYLYGGDRPWVYMGVTLPGVGRVTCELESGTRTVATVGTFALTAGSGSWGSGTTVASGVTGARLVDAAGVTVAEGSFGN